MKYLNPANLAALGLSVLLLACNTPGQESSPASPAPAGESSPPPPALVADSWSSPTTAAPTHPAQLETVTVGTVAIFDVIPLFAAKELGYFEAEGVVAALVQFRAGNETRAALVSRSIDVGMVATETPLILAERGQQLKSLVGIVNRLPLML